MRIKVAGGTGVMEFPMSDSELNARLRRMGVCDVVPRCSLVRVMDEGNPLSRLEGQIVNMDEVNFFAKRMESLTSYEQSVMAAFVNEKGAENLKDLINLTYSMKGLSLITDFSDTAQVGKRLYLDEFAGMSAGEEQGTDFLQFAEKTFRESSVEVLPYGVFVEHGFEMQEVYNGKTFPQYYYNPDKTVCSLELKNKSGDTDYLYLPTDIISVNKLKARLGVLDFWECRVTDIHNLRLPENILPEQKAIDGTWYLTYFNEMCQAVAGFNEDQMMKLSMAVEFTGAKKCTDITYIAKHLGDFEIYPSINNDAEYGEFLVTGSGLFHVDDLLLPHINYADFGADKRKGTLADSGYVSGGFVGASKEINEYLQYEGEFADPLEIDEDCYKTFCLYSPLTGNLFLDGEDAGNLYRSDLTPYEEAISDAIAQDVCIGEEARGLMHYFDESRSVAAKVLTAVPAVQEMNGELYGVLECKIAEPLSEGDIKVLKEYWTGQMSDGWGEGFEQQPIQIDEGELYVSFWNSGEFWSVMTAEELGIVQQQEMSMNL